MTVYLGPAEDQGPEASESFGEAIWFDRRDPRSIRRAQELIQDRLRLPVAPTLCDEPSPGLGAALGRILAALVRGLERWHRRNGYVRPGGWDPARGAGAAGPASSPLPGGGHLSRCDDPV